MEVLSLNFISKAKNASAVRDLTRPISDARAREGVLTAALLERDAAREAVNKHMKLLNRTFLLTLGRGNILSRLAAPGIVYRKRDHNASIGYLISRML